MQSEMSAPTAASTHVAPLLPIRGNGAAAILALADGTVFRGVAIGAPGHSVGEVVFNTAMTGLPGDPDRSVVRGPDRHAHLSAHRQRRRECRRRRIAAAVRGGARDPRPAARRVQFPLDRAISARTSRRTTSSASPTSTPASSRGSCASVARRTAASTRRRRSATPTSPTRVARAKAAPSMAGLDLAQGRELHRAVRMDGGRVDAGRGLRGRRAKPRFHVVAYDFGIKHNILRLLAERGCRVTVVPAQTPADAVLAREARRHLPVERSRRSRAVRLRGRRDPRAFSTPACRLFGICLGHQLLGLAVGGQDASR